MKRLVERIPQSLRQMAVYGTGLVLTKVVSLLMVPVFTNFLSPADYGRLDILQTLANLLSIVIAFGLSQSLFRFAGEAIDDAAKRRTTAEIFGFALILGAVSLTLTQLFAPQIQRALPGDVTETQVRLILGSLALSGAILVPMAWLRMRERAVMYLAASAGCAVAQAALTAVLLNLGYGIEGVLISGLVCMSVTALFVFIWQTRDTGVRLPSHNWGRCGHFGGVLVMAGIAAFIMDSFPRWVLADAVGTAEMAIYALAVKIAMIAGFLTHPFEMWWMPRRFSVLNEADGLVTSARAAEKGIVVAMIAALSVGAAAPLAVNVLTPVEYHGAAVFVPALAVLIAMNATVRLLNVGCLSQEKTIWPLVIDGAAAGLACVSYFVLVPEWGGWGIVAVTMIVACGRIGAYVIIGSRIRAIPYRFGRLAILAGLTVVSAIILTSISTLLGNLLVGVLSIIAITVAAAVLRLIPAPRINRMGKVCDVAPIRS